MSVPGSGSDTPVRTVVRAEIAVVLAVSLGASAVSSLLGLIGDLLKGDLPGQTTSLLGSSAPNHWLDLAYQLFYITAGLAPVALVAFLLVLRPADIGWRTDRPGTDLARGAGVAAVIGGAGLGLYLAARALGLAVTVIPSDLPDVWWRIPVLVLSAGQNALVEEVLLLGWLRARLVDELGWPWWRYAVVAAVLRGSYHLYQGFGAFLGNAVMGLVFAELARRWRRITPLFLAHWLIDTVAFVGAVLLAGHVSFLPAQ